MKNLKERPTTWSYLTGIICLVIILYVGVINIPPLTQGQFICGTSISFDLEESYSNKSLKQIDNTSFSLSFLKFF